MDEYIDKDADSNKVSIRAVTKILNISRSGFKSWKHRKKSHQQLHKERIKEMILTIYHESKEIYGAPKILIYAKKYFHIPLLHKVHVVFVIPKKLS